MKVEAPFIHLIKLHTKYYLYDVNSKMIVNISNIEKWFPSSASRYIFLMTA